MAMISWRSFALIAGCIVTLGQPAWAQSPIFDPTFREFVSNTCPVNCSSAVLAADPISGLTTVEYIFNSTIPVIVAGDLDITEPGGSTVGDLIRFENNGGSADAFIFSADTGGGLAADVGIPAPFPGLTNTVTVAEASNGNSALYTPAAGQPGFCGNCTLQPSYQLQGSLDVPEPGTASLMFGSLPLLWQISRRKRR